MTPGTVREIRLSLAAVLLIATAAFGCSYNVEMTAATTATTAYQVATDERTAGEFVADAFIKKKIQAKILSHPDEKIRGEFFSISVCVHMGRVVLAGQLASPEAVREVVRMAKDTDKVEQVTCYFLPKRDGEAMGDTEIAARVKGSFFQDGDLRGFQVDVCVVQGHVVLAGVVADERSETRCIELARQVEGVERVVEFIQIREPGHE